MTPRVREIYERALELDFDERADLVACLTSTLEDDEELARVVRRRMAELDAGAETVSWEEIRAEIRQKIADARP